MKKSEGTYSARQQINHVTRKPIFGVCDLVRLKPACSATEASLSLENFGFSKYRYYTFLAANNKGADQTARMRRMICAFVVRDVRCCVTKALR